MLWLAFRLAFGRNSTCEVRSGCKHIPCYRSLSGGKLGHLVYNSHIRAPNWPVPTACDTSTRNGSIRACCPTQVVVTHYQREAASLLHAHIDRSGAIRSGKKVVWEYPYAVNGVPDIPIAL